MTPTRGLHGHKVRVIGLHGQGKRLVLQSHHERNLHALVESIINSSVQSSRAQPVGDIVEQHVAACRITQRKHRTVVKLFGPRQHGLQEPRTGLVQTFFIQIFGTKGRHNIQAVVRQCQGIQQQSATACAFERTELLKQTSVRGFRIAHRQNHVSGTTSGHVTQGNQPHMAQESAHRLGFACQRLQFGTQACAECVGQHHDHKSIAGRNHGKTGGTLRNQTHHFINLRLAGFHQTRRHNRHTARFHTVESHLTGSRLGGHIIANRTISLGFKECGQARRTARRGSIHLDMRQRVDQLLDAFAGYRRAVGDHHHLLHAADDGQQLDSGNVRARIENRHISQHTRLGECGERTRRGHQNRLGRGQNLRMITANPAQRHTGAPCQHGVHLVGFLSAGEQHVAQAAHGFLRHHRSDGAHVLHIDLRKAVGCGLQRGTILVGDDGGRTHNVLKHGGPPGQLYFAAHLLHAHSASVEIGDQFVQSGRGEFLLQQATLRQGVQCLAIIQQCFQACFHLLEIGGFQIATSGCGGKHGIQRGHIADQRLLGGDDLVELAGQHRPTAVRHELMPLLPLLGDYLQRFVQVLDLRADAQQILGFLDVAAALPESHRRALGLALALRLGGLDHGADVSLENLRLEHVKHSSQILQNRNLTLPLAGGGRNRESAGLHGACHLLTGGGQEATQQIVHALVGGYCLFFSGDGRLVPCGVFRADGVFAELAGAFHLADPCVNIVGDAQGT